MQGNVFSLLCVQRSEVPSIFSLLQRLTRGVRAGRARPGTVQCDWTLLCHGLASSLSGSHELCPLRRRRKGGEDSAAAVWGPHVGVVYG